MTRRNLARLGCWWRKFSAPNPEARAMIHSMGFYEREIGFYREFAADCPVRTPMCYFGGIEMESGASLLLLEDLSWIHNLRSAGGFVDEAELVVQEIGRLHAAWWGDALLDKTPWLQRKGMMTPHQAPLVFTRNWERFLDKLSIPVTEELISAGALCARCLPAVAVSMHTEPPRTLIYNDLQGDNFLVAGDGEPLLAIVDWQLAVRAARQRRRPARPRLGPLPRRLSRHSCVPSSRGSTIADLPLSVDRAGPD
jgi:hypothetical protein